MSAGGLALRLLAKLGSYRTRDSEHRRLARAKRPGAGRDSPGDAAAPALNPARSDQITLHCNKHIGAISRLTRRIYYPPDDSLAVRSSVAAPVTLRPDIV